MHFLDHLLRPVVQRAMRSTTFLNAANFLHHFHIFTRKKNQFSSLTYFGRFELPQLHLRLTHDQIQDSLSHFLNKHVSPNRLEGLLMMTIQLLIEQLFDHFVVRYEHQLFRVRLGLPSRTSFTGLLIDIFLLHWQSQLLAHPTLKKEFFGRFEHTYFFTYHGSDDRLRPFFKTMKQDPSHLPYDLIMGQRVHFLRINIENQQGILSTSIHHPDQRPSYLLPYVTGHSTLIYAHYFQSWMIHTIRVCSHVADFDQERLHIEMTYLLHGFPLLLIEQYSNEFYRRFEIESLRYSLDSTVYERCRRKLFERIEREQVQYEQQQQWKQQEKFFTFTYPYDLGPRRQFNQLAQQLWTTYIGQYPILKNDLGRIRLTSRSFLSLEQLFTH